MVHKPNLGASVCFYGGGIKGCKYKNIAGRSCSGSIGPGVIGPQQTARGIGSTDHAASASSSASDAMAAAAAAVACAALAASATVSA